MIARLGTISVEGAQHSTFRLPRQKLLSILGCVNSGKLVRQLSSALVFATATLSLVHSIAQAEPAEFSTEYSRGWNLPAQSIAQRSQVRRIQFAPGAYSATVEGGVVRGTRTIYLVGATKGQRLTVKIGSLENSAVFDVAAPSGGMAQRRLLLREASEWTTTLPASGDYQIIVGSTRGNSTFWLQVTIQ
jgi:hypothetical protein